MKGIFTEHSGHRFTYTPKTKIYRLEGRLTAVRYRGLEAGVYIKDLKTGTEIWRPNSHYK